MWANAGRATRIGWSWGLGHGLGTLLLSVVAMGIRAELDLDAVGTGAEAAIGLLLMATGLSTLARARRPARGGQAGAALGIGVVHGVAGGAHVAVVVSALALPLSSALGWLVAFVLGAAGAMATMGWLCRRLGARAPEDWQHKARVLAGGLAVLVGVGWFGATLVG